MTDEPVKIKKPEYNMAEETRYQSILLEEMRSNFQLLSEGLIGLGERMDLRFEEQEAKVNARLDVLEVVVQRNSKDIQELR